MPAIAKPAKSTSTSTVRDIFDEVADAEKGDIFDQVAAKPSAADFLDGRTGGFAPVDRRPSAEAFLDARPSANEFLDAKPSAEAFLDAPDGANLIIDTGLANPPRSSEELGARNFAGNERIRQQNQTTREPEIGPDTSSGISRLWDSFRRDHLANLIGETQDQIGQDKAALGASGLSDEEFLQKYPQRRFKQFGFLAPTEMPTPKLTTEGVQNATGLPKGVSGVVAGSERAIGGVVDFMTSPAGVMTLMTGGAAGAGSAGTMGPGMSKAIATTFAVDMAKNLPATFKNVHDAIEQGDVAGATENILNAGLSLAVIKGTASSYIPKTPLEVKAEAIKPIAPLTAEALKQTVGSTEKAPASSEEDGNLFFSDEHEAAWERTRKAQEAYNNTQPHTPERAAARQELNDARDAKFGQIPAIPKSNPLAAVAAKSKPDAGFGAHTDLTGAVWDSPVNEYGTRRVKTPNGAHAYVDEGQLHPEQIKALDENTKTTNETPSERTPNEPAITPVESASTGIQPEASTGTQEVAQGSEVSPDEVKVGENPAAEAPIPKDDAGVESEPADEKGGNVQEQVDSLKAQATEPETVTNAREENGDAASQQPPSAKRQATDRPWDILDEIEGNIGKIRGLKTAKAGSEEYYNNSYRNASKRGAVRSILSNSSGSSPDEVVDALRRSGFVGDDFSPADLWDAMDKAAQARKGFRKGQTAEKVDQKQYEEFQRLAIRNKRRGVERVPTEPVRVNELVHGDEFTVAGVKVKVQGLHFDPETQELSSVVLEDGRRFGVKTVGADEVLHVDKASLERKQPDSPSASEPSRPEAKERQSGGDLQMAIVPGLKEFTDQDVIPAISKGIESVRESSGELSRALRPPSASLEAKQTAGIIRHNAAELAQKDVQARVALAESRKLFDRSPVSFNLKFIDDMETGRSQPTTELQRMANQLRAAFNERVAQVRALGTGKMEKVIAEYFPHIWSQPTAAQKLYALLFGKKPLAGTAAFLKQRKIPTTADGIRLGLTPVSYNPIELTLLKLHEMDKYVMAHKILNEMKESGLAKFVKATEIPPEGHKPINDRIAEVYEGTTEQGSLAKRGQYYAPDDVARVINNYLSPGLRKFAAYRAVSALSNILNQAQLGLSGYHLRFTAIDSATSKLALAIEQLSRSGGNPDLVSKGLKNTAFSTVGATVHAPAVENLYRGNKVLQEYSRPGSVGGEYAAIVDGLIKGGGRVEMDRFYKNSSLANMWNALSKGNYPGAILRAPFAALELASKPIMEVVVPRMKLGIFADLARLEMEKNPGMTVEQQRETFGKIWDSVDNRMGQMVYDNLFWDKRLKDLALIATRSLGWNLGTVRELGGAVKDTATIASRIRSGEPAVTHRMAYAVALPIIVGTIGAMYQFIHTGKEPDELQDYFLPKTGRTLPDGSPERVIMPSYMKDLLPLVKAGRNFGFAGVSSKGTQMAIHKAGPLITMISDMMQNRDFYGVRIADKNDPFLTEAGNELKFVAEQFQPFSFRGLERRQDPSAMTTYESFTGIMPAPAELTRTKAMEMAAEFNNEKFGGTKTPEEADRIKVKRDLMNRLRAGENVSQEIQKLVSDKILTRQQVLLLTKESHMDPRLVSFDRLPLAEAQQVYDAGTPEEQKLWKNSINKKRMKGGIR